MKSPLTPEQKTRLALRQKEAAQARARFERSKAVVESAKREWSKATAQMRSTAETIHESVKVISPNYLEEQLAAAVRDGDLRKIIEFSYRLGATNAIALSMDAERVEQAEALSAFQGRRRQGKLSKLAQAIDKTIQGILQRVPYSELRPAMVKHANVFAVDLTSDKKIDNYHKLIKRRIKAARPRSKT